MDEQPPWVTGTHVEPTLEDLSIDDTLTSIERVTRYVDSPIALQRLVHVKLLGSTAATAGFQATKEKLLPLFTNLALDEKFVVRQHLCDQIVRIGQFLVESCGDPGYDTLLETLLPHLSKLLNDPEDEVRQAASEALVQAAKLLRAPDLGRHILTRVLQLAHDDEREDVRMNAAWLLNELAPHLGSDLCRQFLVPEIVSLSEDPSMRVRRQTAWNMHHLCRISQHLDGTCGRVLSAFHQLSHDDSHRVRRACAEALPEISKAVGEEERATKVMDMFNHLYEDSQRNVREGLMGALGQFIATLDPASVPPELVLAFTGLASAMKGETADGDLQQKCAFQFPAVVLTLGKERWGDLSPAYHSLARSEHLAVRFTLACSLHEVARVLGSPMVEAELLSVFEAFLGDDEKVRSGVVNNLATFLAHVSATLRESYLPVVNDTLSTASKMNWRLREAIACQLPEFTELFTGDSSHHVLLPLACQLLRDDVSQVRDVALEALPTLVHQAITSQQQSWQESLNANLLGFASSPTYYDRQTFVYMTSSLAHASQAYGNVSPEAETERQYVSTNFLARLPALASDPVPSVRIALARRIVAFPEWCREASHVLNTLSILRQDSNRHIQHAITSPASPATPVSAYPPKSSKISSGNHSPGMAEPSPANLGAPAPSGSSSTAAHVPFSSPSIQDVPPATLVT